ncbi:MAG: TonB family protein [Actinomycetota bacterium]
MNPAPGFEPQVFSVESDHLRAKNQRESFLAHFGFRESPFGVTPNPGFLFFSAIHRQSLQSMIDSIESNLGFTVLMGDPGTGKTTLLFQLMREYQDQARTAFVFQTQCRPQELLRYIASELQLPWHKRDEVSFHQSLNELVITEAQAGRRVLIIIDEAQNLQSPALEAVRLLSGFETGPARLLHVILAGSPRLGETLLSPELSQLAQRITTVCRLEPLTADEVSQYVALRLERAGCLESKDLFTPEALAQVAEESAGVPRRVNSICYRALSLAHVNGERRVAAELVKQAARDLDLAETARMLHLLKPADAAGKPHLVSSRPSAAEDAAGAAEEAPCELADSAPAAPGKPQPESTGPDLLTRFAEALAKDQTIMGDVFKPEASLPEKMPAQKASRPVVSDPLGESIKQRLYAEPPGKTAPVSWKQRLGLVKGGREGRKAASSSSSSSAPAKRSLIVFAVLLSLGALLWLGRHELRARSATPAVDSHVAQAAAPGTGSHVAQAAAPGTDPQLVANNVASLRPVAVAPPDTGTTAPKVTQRAADPRPAEAAKHDSTPSEVRTVEDIFKSRITTSAIAKSTLTQSNFSGQPSSTGDVPAPAGIATLAGAANAASVAPLTSLPASVPRLASSSMVNDSSTKLKPTRVVQPSYPENAKLWHLEGDVTLELNIDAKGRVRKVRLLRGNPILAQAAEAAARQWQYPPLPNGAAPAVTQAQFKFRLDGGGKR